MTILELRLLISGDFLLCDNGFNGFVRYYLRLIICLSFLSVSIFELFKIYNKVEFIKKHLLFIEILLLLSSFVILLYGYQKTKSIFSVKKQQKELLINLVL